VPKVYGQKFKFRQLHTIGVADAEEDKTYLAKCFVDTGILEALRDCSNQRRIVVGPTGCGKSALLIRLEQTFTNTISIPPESLALSYITSSNVLSFVSELGVKLDIFFRLLWRHVFAVEILRSHFRLRSDKDRPGFLARIRALVSDRRYNKALEYLENWGESFWEDPDYRIKEVTKKLESEIEGSLKSKIPGFEGTVGATKKVTEEQKHEIVSKTQALVNQVQVRELSQILELLDYVLREASSSYIITIDRLDEGWIEDRLRYVLIRALIETVKDFRKVQNAKIVVALRRDLLDRVFRMTRDAGFQEEKYESLFVDLSWSKGQLVQVLDTRVGQLVQSAYSKAGATHRDLMPTTVKGQDVSDFLISRTLLRPRDMIQLFNCCIQQAPDRPAITVDMIRNAEGEYSRSRLRAVCDEWRADYPNLGAFTGLVKGQTATFSLGEISADAIEEFCLLFASEKANPEESDILSTGASAIVNRLLDAAEFRKTIFRIFYRTGLVGLKLETFESTVFSSSSRRHVEVSEMSDKTKIAIHPAFWRVLGIRSTPG
jgi:hypothetical protein